VVDRQGNPVEDLRASEIELKVDGRRRVIDSLSFVRIDSTHQNSGKPDPAALADPARKSPLSRVRTIVIVFDIESIRTGNERAAKEGAQSLLDELTPGDRVGLVTLPYGRVNVDLTTDYGVVRQQLAGIMGSAAAHALGGCELSRLTIASLESIRAILERLVSVEGSKTLIVVSGGLVPADGMGSKCDSPRPYYSAVSRAAAQALTHVYAIQPDSFQIDAGRRGFQDVNQDRHKELDRKTDGLEDLTGVAGGALFRLSARADAVYRRILRETSGYYLLGFVPDPSERDGREHSIRIAIQRSTVTVRARRTFMIPATR
jgi:VWFA-related protein